MYRQEVQSLVEAVHDILDEYAPLEALRVWFLRLADFVRVKHGHRLSLERWTRRRWRTTSAARDNGITVALLLFPTPRSSRQSERSPWISSTTFDENVIGARSQ